MILLFLLPFYDRSPERRPERRPIATTAGIFMIVAMGYLTYLGASAGSPNAIEIDARLVAAGRRLEEFEPAGRSSPSRAAWPATRSARTATTGPGPELTEIGGRLPDAGDRSARSINPTAPMPSFAGTCPQEKSTAMVAFLAAARGEQ